MFYFYSTRANLFVRVYIHVKTLSKESKSTTRVKEPFTVGDSHSRIAILSCRLFRRINSNHVPRKRSDSIGSQLTKPRPTWSTKISLALSFWCFKIKRLTCSIKLEVNPSHIFRQYLSVPNFHGIIYIFNFLQYACQFYIIKKKLRLNNF